MARSYFEQLLLVTLLFIAVLPQAQSQVMDGVPHLINYQGRLTDTDGSPVGDGEYLITFTLWSDSVSTSPADRKWISSNCPVLVINGLFNWQLGSRENLPPWAITNYTNLWLGIEVGDDPELSPRNRLGSAPYAYKAWQADYTNYADSAGMLTGECHCSIQTGGSNGTGSFVVSFDPEFPPGLTPHVFANGVLAADDPGTSGLTRGMAVCAVVTNVSNNGFTVTLRVGFGGSLMPVATADIYYIAVR
ncbi:hypothetical protein C3F09_12290 [candidate division GN15 bacterium]|uniref:Uncharacterized protein n=1 Tax=candidate division GN15 bacterium TaxID=2072418 RepID=A0A855WU45_9BACT|nr:MAG: hypothetical protein C3F09_12290 [candidate division GN15 bacterium]